MAEPARAHPDVELTRRERRKREVRERILEAAVALFDEQGFRNARVADICERADVAHKTFFNHFPSKQHLLEAIAGFALDSFLGLLETARQRPGPPRERLAWLFGRIADRAEAAGPMRPELVHEMIRLAYGTDAAPERARRLHDGFGALVREGRRAGAAGPDAETLTELVLGAFYAVILNWANFEGYPLRRRALAAARVLGDAMDPSAAGRAR